MYFFICTTAKELKINILKTNQNIKNNANYAHDLSRVVRIFVYF